MQQQHCSDHPFSDLIFVGQNLLDLNGNGNFPRDVENENQELEQKRKQKLTTIDIQNGRGELKRKSFSSNVDSNLF